MVGMYGIGNVPEAANAPRADEKVKRAELPEVTEAKDGVTISPEAKEAAEAARLTQQTRDRYSAERVERAKESLEEGTYRVQEVVKLVAARVSRHLAV